jgi:hypothetical protein
MIILNYYCFNFSLMNVSKPHDHIELLSQCLIELLKFQSFVTISKCCFNLSLNWCFNSHDHIQLLFQFSH